MVAFPENTPLQEIADRDLPFSRIPVFEKDRDHITGFVLKSDLFEALADGELRLPGMPEAAERIPDLATQMEATDLTDAGWTVSSGSKPSAS